MGGEAVFANFRRVPKKLWDKLRNKEYRDGYVAEHVRRGLAYQIRALRDQREWNQGKLSQIMGKPQSVVCRLEDPNYGKVTVQTLLDVASAFDVALQLRFVSFSGLVQQTRDLTQHALEVPSFGDDIGKSVSANYFAIRIDPPFNPKKGVPKIDTLPPEERSGVEFFVPPPNLNGESAYVH
jgi:hypothetical protein